MSVGVSENALLKPLEGVGVDDVRDKFVNQGNVAVDQVVKVYEMAKVDVPLYSNGAPVGRGPATDDPVDHLGPGLMYVFEARSLSH